MIRLAPPRLHSVADARRLARRRLPRLVFDFIDGAAGEERGAAANREAFQGVRLQPRALARVADPQLGVRLLGREWGLPIGVAPMGMCALAWPGADAMLAEAAAARGVPVCVSTASSASLEAYQTWAPGCAWFQLYVSGDAEAAFAMVDRAAAAGYETLILTVDVPVVARRPRDLRNGFATPFRIGPRQALDFARRPRWALATLRAGAPGPANFDGDVRGFQRDARRDVADWAFAARLRDRWRGRLIVKGVQSTEDAHRLRDLGVDALQVSNHGGRQLDAAPPALESLARIRAALGPDFPLLFDSGVRSGEDVIKALALGADFVMLGRPLLFAIGADGARGLATTLQLFETEIATALAQIGLRDVAAVGARALAETGDARPPEGGKPAGWPDDAPRGGESDAKSDSESGLNSDLAGATNKTEEATRDGDVAA